MNPEELSDCCGAPVLVAGEGITHYYVCTLCDKACDCVTTKGAGG